jgi:hypothetical protein
LTLLMVLMGQMALMLPLVQMAQMEHWAAAKLR